METDLATAQSIVEFALTLPEGGVKVSLYRFAMDLVSNVLAVKAQKDWGMEHKDLLKLEYLRTPREKSSD
jgi:hypothetical protein